MVQDTYNVKKVSGLGIKVMTFLSIATISSNTFGESVTLSSNKQYSYEAISVFNDSKGELCTSSPMPEYFCGEIMADNDDFGKVNIQREKRRVQLQITKIRKHVSHFEFEEEFEEI